MEISAHDSNVEGSMTVLLKDAIKPNLVQTLEGNPAIIHGGLFANIAHGCNSIIATRMAMNLGDYTVTEACFGADLGAEKFLDIKCQTNGISPNAIVLVATIRSLKYHGGMSKEDITNESTEYLEKGLDNLFKHYDNLTNVYKLNVVIAINRFNTDTDNEIEYLCNILDSKNLCYAVTTGYSDGSKGSIELASKVMELCDEENNFRCSYDLEDDIKTKIFKVSTKVYGAKDVEYSSETIDIIDKLEKDGYGKLPICIAKT